MTDDHLLPPDPSHPEGESSAVPADVLIVGASARAAAYSALRGGLQPVCFDQFADIDLQAVASVRRLPHYPDGLIDELAAYSDTPILYTGGLENHPGVLEVIEDRLQLLGNGAATVRTIREPVRVQAALDAVKIPTLTVRSSSDPPPADGCWLLKPLRGAGGRGVTVWEESAAQSPTLREPRYFQYRAEGEAYSAVFLAQQDPFQFRYVGLTRQLVGLSELNAAPFAWCGTIGPVALDTESEILIRRTGTVLAHQFGLQGLFGCDFILEGKGRPLLTEINPRYTASVEVIETLCGSNLVCDHCEAMGMPMHAAPDVEAAASLSEFVVGKVVLFSDRELTAPDTGDWSRTSPWQPVPGFADIPQPGQLIPAGGPICSILAAADSTDVCLQYLLRSAADVFRTINGEAADSEPLEN